jgi:PAS domain S-box-containing protein
MTAPSVGRVLIVDDEVELMTALCESLTAQGYEAVGRTSGHEALALLQEQDVDLLVCDLMMPDMDGMALLRAALDIDPHLGGIIMTGQDTMPTALDALQCGAFDYLPKPFRLQTLLPVLARALLMRQLHMDNMQLRKTVAMYELGQAIAYTLDMDTLLHTVANGALQQVNGHEAAIMLPIPDAEELFVAVVRGASQEALLGKRVSMVHSPLGWVVRHHEPLTVPGTVSDLPFPSRHTLTDLITLVLPMLAGSKLMGVLSVSAIQQRRPFTRGQVQALRVLTNLAATALEHVTLDTQVRQSEERFRSITESAMDAIISTDANGHILSWNSGAQRLFGYECDEMVGQPLTRLMPARYRGPCLDGLRQVVTTGQQRLMGKTLEVHGLTREGDELPVELSLSSWQTGDSTFFGAIIRDISERKRLETQLRQAQKMQAIGTLTGGIAHDFNNILSAILGYAELALDEVEQGSAVWHDLQGTLTAGRRAKDLVRQILAFSRQTERARTSIHLHFLVEEALALLRAALPSTITIRPIIDRNAGAVLADPTQMQQVLINLCTNAAHAMRETGGVLEVRLEPVELALEAPSIAPGLKAGAYVRLTVQDTGHGMAPAILERIFEPFFTTKGMGEGTGMGLAVAHGIIAHHEGAITVESTPGQGSTFAVYLPRSDRPGTAPLLTEEPVVGGKERILFVDDETALVHVGRATLQRLGYQVVVCTSSSEALETFRAAPYSFDLVITDRTMPSLTGDVLVRELRHIRPNIPIILCTGFSHPVTSEQLRALEVDAFLLKPVMVNEWARVIRQVLERRT